MNEKRIEQINHSFTLRPGTVRGFHYQRPPHAETKVVSCLRGSVFDVAVDLRAGSPTFLQWHGEILSPENGVALIIPEGFAHGFQTLQPDCELLYLHTASYTPTAESGLNAMDGVVGVTWPQEVADVSDKDASLPFVNDEFKGLFV